MFTEEDKKRYLKIGNFIYDGLMLYDVNPYDETTHFIICEINKGTRKLFENIASAIQYIYDNNFAVYSVYTWTVPFTDEHNIDINVLPDLETTIGSTVYDLLKDFGNKKTPEFKQQLENAILNGHITFKQYNELCKEVQYYA